MNWNIILPIISWAFAFACIGNLYRTRRKINGYRAARTHDHRRAPDPPSPAALSALLASFAAGGPPPAGEAAGDDSDPRAGDSPSVEGPDPDAKAPDAIEPIYAWRAWTVKPDGTLYATNQETTWLPGRATEAYCRGGSHTNHTASAHLAPHESCGCGLYAAKDVADIMYSSGQPFIWGECALWGKICVYSKGFRAQFGYPARNLKLYYPHVHGIFEEKPKREHVEAAERLARKVSEIYGVPVAVASEAEGKTLGIGTGTVVLRGLTTTSGTSNPNYAPGTIYTTTGTGVQQWQQTSTTTSYTPTTIRQVPPNPSGFTTYSSYQQFQEHQQKAMKAVAEAMAANQKRQRGAERKASVERANAMQRAYEAGIVLPKPGDFFLDSGQARAAYEFDDPTREENSRAD